MEVFVSLAISLIETFLFIICIDHLVLEAKSIDNLLKKHDNPDYSTALESVITLKSNKTK
ncbi:hypothetical protein D3C71_1952590 [compost metagenome]